MTMKPVFIIASIFYLLLTPLNLVAESEGVDVIGKAYSLNEDDLLYTEIHCQPHDSNHRKVTYLDDDNHLIAEKWVDYRSGLTTPSFTQINHWTGEFVEVRFFPEKIKVSYQSHASSTEVDQSNLLLTEAHTDVVVGAGVDAFIRNNWNTLVSGERMSFRFPVASRKALFDVNVRAAFCSYQNNGHRCFLLEPENWLVRMLVDPIELGYDTESRKLMRYRGLSNLEGQGGENMVVDIHYQYGNSKVSSCAIDTSPSLRLSQRHSGQSDG